MKRGFYRLLSLDPSDQPRLWLLAPSFAISAATLIILASVSKALFLAAHPVSRLPWLYLGSALFTAVIALSYVHSIERTSLERRFRVLLSAAIVSFGVIRLIFPSNPEIMSIVIFLWCPGVGYLVAVQAWNMSSSLLPTRQAKRLVPVLASLATLGAVLGGLLVQLFLTWSASENLIWLAVALLSVLLLTVGHACEKLRGQLAFRGPAVRPRMNESREDASAEIKRDESIRSLFRQPMLRNLALFVFMAQVASLVVDYQFSAEIQGRYRDPDAMASFLGAYYWIANLVIFVLTLFVTRRVVRVLGIGVALCAGVVFLALGSGSYLVAVSSGLLPAFWVITTTAFMERLGHFALTRSATQMLVMPLDTRTGERAKTLVDGVVYKVASVAGALCLLVFVNVDIHLLSLLAVVAAFAAVWLGLRMGPLYRDILFDALKERKLHVTVTRYLRNGLGRRATRQLEDRLISDDRETVIGALSMVRDLGLPVKQGQLDILAASDDDTAAGLSLEVMQVLGRRPSPLLLIVLLNPERPVDLLRRTLKTLPYENMPGLDKAIHKLIDHPDEAVSSLAGVFWMRVSGGYTTGEIEREIDQDESPERYLDVHARPPRAVTGQVKVIEIARELPEKLKDPSMEVRRNTVRTMGELGLPKFVEHLVECLKDPDLRPDAVRALVSYGADVLSDLNGYLKDDLVGREGRLAITRIAAKIGGMEAMAVLEGEVEAQEQESRTHALAAMWRLVRNPAEIRPEPEWCRSMVLRELETLKHYAAIEVWTPKTIDPRMQFFREELVGLRNAAERRVFYLLGMLYPRDAMYKAYLYYRSENTRSRSNALELLDQHISDSSLRVFVMLVEGAEETTGEVRPRSSIFLPILDNADPLTLLGGPDAWLRRVWDWAHTPDEVDEDTRVALDRAVEFTRLRVFEGINGPELLELARRMVPTMVARGDVIVEQGEEAHHLHVVMGGEVAVFVHGQEVAHLGDQECVGLMALLEEAPYGATVKACQDMQTLAIPSREFRQLIDMHPPLSKWIVCMLARRIRIRMDAPGLGGVA